MNPVKHEEDEWSVIPLKACRREELVDTRNHIIRFQNKQDVDIVKNFAKPVRMHRKDPRTISVQLPRKEIDRRRNEGIPVSASEEGYTEMVMGDDGNLYPVPDTPQYIPEGRRSRYKKKTKQVKVVDNKLRYEEYYPWVVEDYEGANVFAGSYEAALLASTHVLFVFDKDGFKLVPAEKVYKFTPRNKYRTLTVEEAEAKMEKKLEVPRWFMRHMLDELAPVRPLQLSASSSSRGMRTVQGNTQGRDLDHDDLDFDEEFADDEEAPIVDGDEEENKLLEKKIKKEMLKNTHFEQLDASDGDLDDLFETEKTRKVDKEGAKLRKVLTKNEGAVYEEEQQENPYVLQSDLELDELEPEVAVKAEEEVPDVRPRAFYVLSLLNGIVVIRAPPVFLGSFPPGEWNPNAKRRQVERVGAGQGAGHTAGHAAGQAAGQKAGDRNLVTTEEVLDIVRQNPLTTKELLVRLRSRINTHVSNKARIIEIVKLNLKLVDGKLVLKEG